MGRGTDLSQLLRNTNKEPIGVVTLLNSILRTYLLGDMYNTRVVIPSTARNT